MHRALPSMEPAIVRPEQIQIRDPFVLPVPESGHYFLYGTTDKWCWSGPGTGFDYYVSRDLRSWRGPFAAFRPVPGFWAETNFWAPEVYRYAGCYFMFASFKSADTCRGTQVLTAESPEGPFTPHTESAITPADWECLDGSLHLEDGSPWLVYCHEWVQIHDGAVYAQQLDRDLKHLIGEPVRLFSASEAPWVCKGPGGGFVTDGPFPFRTREGELMLLWSSFARHGYAVGMARSRSGRITGPWEHRETPLFDFDGGHAMVFEGFDGRRYVAFHAPNDTPNERPVFLPFDEQSCWIPQSASPHAQRTMNHES